MKTINSLRSKLLAFTLALMASVSSFAKDGYPDFEVDGLYYNFLEGDSVQVTFQMQSGSPIPTTANNISNKKNLSGVGYGQLTELVVPSTVTYEDKTYHVSRIGIAAFLECVNLAHIDLPTSIKSIGMAAFQSCHALSSITLNEGVESIELQVFANCIKLKEVTLPSTLKSMGRRVFDLSKSLSKVVCKATTPPTVEEDLLTGSGDTNISNATLYVPVQSLTTYQNTYPWNTFGQILPIEDSFQEIFPTLWGLERTEVEGTTMGFDEPYQMSFSQYTPTLVDGTWYLYDGRNYFREANNQILWYAPEFNITDAVLYDWTLEVGDTLPIYTPTFSSDAKRGTMFRVTDVSTIKLLDGKEYKKWTFSGGYEYVEGIGAINKGFGLYYCLLHNAHPAIYTSTKTICISKNGQLLYQMDEVEMLQNGFECMCELTPAYKDQWCNIWNVVEFDGMRFEETAKTWQYRLAQDTVIDNQIYTFVNCHWTADKNNKYRCAAVRFTEDKKVYVHYLGKEYLLYDFDVQVGDTLEVFAGLNNAYDCLTCTCVVNKVRYSKTNKAIIELSAFGDDDENKYYPFDLRWIEGVGADEGFLMGPVGLNGRVGGYSRLLMCAYQDHQLVYETDNSYLAQFNCEYNAGHEHSSPTLEGLHRTACKEFIGYEGIHETSAIETGKEVLINDKFYKLWDKWLLREENDKIYVYSNKKDILLYDFTLEVGDSLRTLTLHPTIGIIDFPIGTIYPIDTLIVTDISTIKLLDGKEYTKWSFNHGAFEYVKGIGCLDGNFLALAKDIENDGVNTHLVCVSKNGQLLYHMDDAEMARLGTECKQVRYNEALLGKWRDVNGNQTVTITDSIIFLDNRELTLTYTASATQLSVKRLWEYDLYSSENCDYLLWGDTLWIDNFIPSLVATFPPQYEPITLVREKDGPSYKSQWCDTWNILVKTGSVHPPVEATYRYQLAQDTVIGDYTYTAVVSKAINDALDAPRYVAAVRFTDDRKVYIYYDNAEYLLYDFNVQEGDELEVFAGINNYTSEIKTYKCTVTGVEQYACVGCPAAITLEVHNHPNDFREFYRETQWIEGVGDINGFLNGINHYVEMDGGGSEYLLCAYQGDELKYTGPLYEKYGCEYNANDPLPLYPWCNQWNILAHGYLGPQEPLYGAKTTIYQLGGDTIINHLRYQQLTRYASDDTNQTKTYVGAIRFTKNNRQVYFYYDNAEYLLYDFKAQVGDTLEVFAGIDNYRDNKTYKHVVTNKEPIQDEQCKVTLDVFVSLELEGEIIHEEKFTTTWIEGVGSPDGIVHNCATLREGNLVTDVLCAYVDDRQMYRTPSRYYSILGCEYNDGDFIEGAFPILSGLQRTVCKEYYGETEDDNSANSTYKQTFDQMFFENDKPYILCSGYLLREEDNMILIYSQTLNKDLVLYDFTLEVGDSLLALYINAPQWDPPQSEDIIIVTPPYNGYVVDHDYNGKPDPVVVTDISTVTLLDGKEYKKWTFNNGMEYVEGIGSFGNAQWSGDFFQLIANKDVPTCLLDEHLVCASKNGQLLYQMDDAEMERLGTTCLCAQLGRGETDNAKEGKIGGRPTPTQWFIVEINQEVIYKLPAQRLDKEESSILSAETFIYTLENDSLRVNGKKYFNLSRYSSKESPDTKVNVGALHFENDNRVWFYHDNTEYLLYDFSAEVGDTLQLFAGIHNYPTDSVYTHVVTAKDTLEDGIARVTLDAILYENVDGQLTEQHWEKVWLAGLGSTDGIVHNSAKRANNARNNIEQSHVMLCAWRDDECLYTTNHPDFINVGCEYNHDFTVLEDIHSSGSNYQKLIRDGQLFIIHNGRTYNVLGVQQ